MTFGFLRRSALTAASVAMACGQSVSYNFDKVPSGTWHTLRVVAKGDHMVCYFNGKALIDAHDKTYTNGEIGL